MRVFFLVLARDRSGVEKKARELDSLGVPYLIVCGDNVNHPNAVHREPMGKYDAINFASHLLPKEAEIVGLNDVDTEIHNLEAALRLLNEENVSLVFVRVNVKSGPQVLFYSILDALRRRIPIAASGELMLMKREVFQDILPLEACKSEDSYMLFKVLEHGHKVAFCEECYVTTKRTFTARQEEDYKRRTVGGIYQALSITNPPTIVKLFYVLLPFASIILLPLGSRGYYWVRGIVLGFADYLRGDRAGSWQKIYVQS